MKDVDYVAAWNSGGGAAVEQLLKARCPDEDTRIRELQRLEDLGTWDILWHTSSDTGETDFGIVREYRGT